MNGTNKSALRSLLGDSEIMQEMQGRHAQLRGVLESVRAHDGASLDSLLEGQADAVSPGAFTAREAIVLLRGRPPLLIQDGAWEDPKSALITQRLGNADSLRANIAKVGRVEILDYATDFVGTGWMIDEDVLITNRHVAELFAEGRRTFSFRIDGDGKPLRAQVDFLREHERTGTLQAAIKEIVYLEDNSTLVPDMALVRLDRTGITLPTPLELGLSPLVFDAENPTNIAVVGYPAADPRNDAIEMDRIFRGIYNVKRLCPGRVMSVGPGGKLLQHDATTLGGASGSPVIDTATGKAIGLHFSGTYRKQNVAVTSKWLKERLADLGTRTISLPSTQAEAAAPNLAGRKGYRADFLGTTDEHAVELPRIEATDKIAKVRGEPSGELKYTHFSIVMRADRRLPFFTAVNIDGDKLFNFARARDSWFVDGRLQQRNDQIDNALYVGNNLDRGHLVRRLDPAWGATREEAKRAELDTFFYTNASPQHANLNQRTWLSLEDYVLGNADTRDLKISVFSGPVMDDADVVYRDVKIPREFWKVVVMVNAATGALSATGYLLSQASFLGDIEFVFGAFKTYQVPIAQIEKKTGLSFDLSGADPLGNTEAMVFREVRDAADVTL